LDCFEILYNFGKKENDYHCDHDYKEEGNLDSYNHRNKMVIKEKNNDKKK